MTRDTINMIIGILGSNTEIVGNYIVYKTYDDSSIGGVWVNNNVEQQIYNSNERCWYMILMDGVTIIGGGQSTDYSPFYGNSNVAAIDLSSSGLTSIGDWAFSYCSGLTSITIPDSITSISEGAFNYCSKLTSITIPIGVTFIGRYAFVGCSKLTSITIPIGVTFIGRYAFVGCSGLTSIVVDSNNTSYDSRNNCNAIIESSTNTLIAGCQNTVIPNDVTSIGNNAFDNCTSLTSITIPDSITSIGDWAFSYCLGLTSITIPDSVTSISEGAFNSCSGLTSVTCLATTPPTLGTNAFQDINTTNCIVPQGYEQAYFNSSWYVGRGGQFETFNGISNNRKIQYTTLDNQIVTSDWIEANTDSNTYSQEDGGIMILKNNINNLGVNAFRDCWKLTSIIIPDSIISIGQYAFYNCSGLTSITIPNGVTSIGQGTFIGCSGLTSITIPNGVTSIIYPIFGRCTGLTSIIVDSNNPIYDSRDNCNAIIETSTNKLIQGCKNTTIPNTVTSIGYSAFNDCIGLTSITIPDSITSIGNDAFNSCYDLISITIPDSITSIGGRILLGCRNLTSITVDSNNPIYDSRDNCNAIIETSTNKLIQGCKNTTIPNTVTSIGYSAFYSSSLASITIPNSIVLIESNAFEYCSNLTSIEIPNSVTSIENSAFRCCNGLTSITVDSNNPIYDSRDNCNAIVETSTNKLIQGCKNTIIPNDVTSIDDYAFEGCSGLESIIIPNSVTSIGYGAFGWFSSLTSVTCLATTPPTLGSNNFTASNDTLYVPSESVSAYESDANWSAAFTTITAIQ